MRIFTLFGLALFTFSCSQNKTEIAFLSKDAGITTLYVMEGDEEFTPISQPNAKATSPELSPNRDKIAYMSEDMGTWDIWIYDIKEKTSTNLTESNEMDGSPSWSPDGNSIAYMSLKNDNRDVYVHNLKTNVNQRVTFNESIDLEPVWSEGLANTLYFKSIRQGFESIYQLSIPDSMISMVSSAKGNSSNAKIIPKHNQLSYVRFMDGIYAICVFDEESRNTKVIIESETPIKSTNWSAQGDHLAIGLNDKVQVYLYGQDKVVLKENIPNAQFPIWSNTRLTLFYNLKDEQGEQIYKFNMLEATVVPISPASINAFHPLPFE